MTKISNVKPLDRKETSSRYESKARQRWWRDQTFRNCLGLSPLVRSSNTGTMVKIADNEQMDILGL